jgi:hypothetical protein
MAAAFVSTILSPIAPITQHLGNTWVIGGPATIATRTAAVGIRIGILTVTVTIAVVVVMIGIEIGIHMDATVVTGVIDVARRQVEEAAVVIRPTIGVAGVTPEARLAEAAPLEPRDGTMKLRPQLHLQPMRLGGEHPCHMGEEQNVFE